MEPGLSGADIDDSMREKHFVTLAKLVETHTGIQLPMNKRVMLEGRLRRRVRALGLANLTEYGNAIFEDGRLEEEFDHVVDCATTNKTDFFREPAHFAFLREHAIPIALQQRSGRNSLKFWSAAASNGAEAYTIAMVAAETLGLGSRAFSVLGTDISRGVIAEARRAIYPSSFVDPVPRALRDRYLMAARDARRREVRVVPELRRCWSALSTSTLWMRNTPSTTTSTSSSAATFSYTSPGRPRTPSCDGWSPACAPEAI